MAKQTKSTQESAKPKKPLLNWGKREKVVSSVKDSITPSGDLISYKKKTVTAPASILGGSAMKKEVKKVSKYGDKVENDGFRSDSFRSFSSLFSRNKSKEGQKSKSYSNVELGKVVPSSKDSTISTYDVDKSSSSKLRMPTKLLKGVEKNVKDSSMTKRVTKYDSPKLEEWTEQLPWRTVGKKESVKKTLALPKSTAKNMKDTFDNMKSSPEYIVTKTKKSNSKY